MRHVLTATVVVAACGVAARVEAQKAALVFAGAANPSFADQSVIVRLEQEFGLETVLIDHGLDGFSKNDILDREEVDLIIILESTGSGSVANQLNDREEPMLVQEAFLFDDMGFVAGTANCTDCWGEQGEDFGNQAAQTDLFIASDDHPIVQAAGLAGAGTVAVHEFPVRMQWVLRLVDEAVMLAFAADSPDDDGDGMGDNVAAFVLEPGAELADGSMLAGLRIGAWVHTEGGDVASLTPDGLAFWDAMVSYALDPTPQPGVCGEPPATASRTIVTALDPGQADCGGDFKDGDVLTVEIEVGEFRAAGGDCTSPAGIRITERPPAGWMAGEISDGGTLTDDSITWDLVPAEAGATRTIRYQVVAAAPETQEEVRFDGELLEVDAQGNPAGDRARRVSGEDSLLSDPEECGAKAVLILANAGTPSAGDQAVIDRLEQEFGMATVLIDHAVAGATKNSILDAEQPDVILILESTSSGNVTNQLNDRAEAILMHENFLFDDMLLVLGTAGCDLCWGDLGSDFGNQAGVTELTVVHDDHPIIVAAGLDGAGAFEAFEVPARVTWGRGFVDDVEILTVATDGFDEDGDGVSDDVTTFVAEPGTELLDGSELPGLRIGLWVHAENEGFTLLTEEGLALWDTCVRYALGDLDGEPAEPRFVRGDIDADGAVALTDAIVTLDFLFLGGSTPLCMDAADVDDNGGLEIADPIGLLAFLFAGAAPPPAPFPDCGVDLTADTLTCESFLPCP